MHMALNNPWILLFIPIVYIPVVIVYRRARNNRSILSATLGFNPGKKTLVYDVIKFLALFFIVLSIANPVLVSEKTIPINNKEALAEYNDRLPAQFIVLIDVSPSMHRDNRLDEAIKALNTIIDCLNKSDRIVIAVFGGEVKEIYNGPSFKASNITGEITKYNIKYTAIANAIGWAVGRIKASGIPSIVFIVTDGANNYGGDPAEAACTVNASGTPIVFIRIDNDPRGTSLFYKLSAKGVKTISIEGLDKDSIRKLLENTILESKLQALKASGKAYITITEISQLPTAIALTTALIMLIVSRLEGV